jgi:hypothetical protein
VASLSEIVFNKAVSEGEKSQKVLLKKYNNRLYRRNINRIKGTGKPVAGA